MMDRKKSIRAAGLIAILVMSTALAAQYQHGDLIIAPGLIAGGRGHLLGVTPAGSVYSLRTPPFDYISGLMRSPDNRGLWITGKQPTHPAGLFEIAPNGSMSTIAPIDPLLLGVDGEGGAVALQFVTVLKVARGPVISTLYSLGTSGLGILGVDGSRGDLILKGSQSIERLNLAGVPALTTIKAWPSPSLTPNYHGAGDHDPATDLMVCGSYTGRNGQITTFGLGGGFHASVAAQLGVLNYFAGVDIDPVWRAAIVSLRHYSIAQLLTHSIELYDLNTATHVRTILTGSSNFSIYPFRTVLARTRHLCAVSPATRGGVFSALVSSPAEPGSAYAVAFSFGLRPGIPTPGGRRIYLQPDALFAWSLTNRGIFSDCQGVLNQRGEAVARMAIPRIPTLAGRRVFAVAVTIANQQIRTISAPIGVTIR